MAIYPVRVTIIRTYVVRQWVCLDDSAAGSDREGAEAVTRTYDMTVEEIERLGTLKDTSVEFAEIADEGADMSRADLCDANMRGVMQ